MEKRLSHIFKHALPVMLGYLAIGFACGILESKAGFHPAVAFIFSMAFYTGAGQFMIPSMYLAGSSLFSIIASCVLVSARQMLYSAAFSPYLATASRLTSFLFGATVTDESFGVNLSRFDEDPSWTPKDAFILNTMCQLSWASANALGCVLGSVLELPLSVLSFAMTSIFICLLVARDFDGTAIVVTVAAFVAVIVSKLIGLTSLAIFLGALVAILCGLLFERGAHSS